MRPRRCTASARHTKQLSSTAPTPQALQALWSLTLRPTKHPGLHGRTELPLLLLPPNLARCQPASPVRQVLDVTLQQAHCHTRTSATLWS